MRGVHLHARRCVLIQSIHAVSRERKDDRGCGIIETVADACVVCLLFILIRITNAHPIGFEYRFAFRVRILSDAAYRPSPFIRKNLIKGLMSDLHVHLIAVLVPDQEDLSHIKQHDV